MRIEMKLEDIIKAIRRNSLATLLGDQYIELDFDKIIIFAEHSVSTDTEYRFFKSKIGMGELLKEHNISYERLCSLKELSRLIDLFLAKYDKKTDDVLVIEIIDHLDNNKI
ncbi:hypothetical protein SAMN05421785_10867 [Chryseobacterium gambrini]|uniref:Uncharacterized protein n=2 Tax=Chryseobacterium gambrini TaxID=373672 RepID=A0A1N7Q0C9_9FLAO|nr:hypothetical protein SAMN05421785_10867 [Chryseobacterium gambrini]